MNTDKLSNKRIKKTRQKETDPKQYTNRQKTNRTIHIAVVTDNNYIIPLCVMLTSLFENNKQLKIQIHVLYFKLKHKNKDIIIELIQRYKHYVKFHNININKVSSYFKDFGHVSKTTYLKFYIPKVVKDVDRILYLDSDIIVRGSLDRLWNTKLKDKILGAITECSDNQANNLGYNHKYGYFNAGVLLIDIVKWKNLDISNKLIEYVKNNQNKIVYWDKDAFNAILHSKWLHLPAIYNFQTYMYLDKNKYIKDKEPIIVHYTTDAKPWSFRCNHPLRNEFWKYLSMTRWKNYKIEDKTPKNYIYHYMPIKLDIKLSAFIRKLQGKP